MDLCVPTLRAEQMRLRHINNSKLKSQKVVELTL